MLLAVLEKRGGLKVSACDAYMNIIGGLTLLYPGWATDIVGIVLVGGVVLFQRSGRKKLA